MRTKRHRIVSTPCRLILARGSQIEQLQLPIRQQHHICRFHVSIHNGRLLSVQKHEYLRNFVHPFTHARFTLWALFAHQLMKRNSLKIFSNKAQVFTVHKGVYNAHNARVAQARKQVYLGAKHLLRRSIFGNILGRCKFFHRKQYTRVSQITYPIHAVQRAFFQARFYEVAPFYNGTELNHHSNTSATRSNTAVVLSFSPRCSSIAAIFCMHSVCD